MKNKFILESMIETKANDTADDNNEMLLTGILSTTKSRSMYGELMSPEALQQMCEDAVGLPILEGHDGGGLDKVIGIVKNAFIEDGDLHIDFNIVPRHQERMQEYIDDGIPIGLSIGGKALIGPDEIVESITLIEASLTPIPANREAHRTVTVKEDYVVGSCLTGVCDAIIKRNHIKEDVKLANEPIKEPTDDNKAVEEVQEPLTIEKVKEMLDERFAEEKQSIIDEVLNEVKNIIDNSEEKPEEEKKVEEASESPEEEDKKDEEEIKEVASEEEEEEEEKEVKESAEPTVNINLDSDDIVNKLADKIFSNLENKRDLSLSATSQAIKDSASTEEEDKKFTTDEAAKMIIRSMDKKDPLVRAIKDAANR